LRQKSHTVPALGVTDSIVAFEGWLRTVTLQKLTTGHSMGVQPGGRTHLSKVIIV